MLKLFGLCSGSTNNKLKPGEVGIHAYQVKKIKKRDMLAFTQDNAENILLGNSFKNEVLNE